MTHPFDHPLTPATDRFLADQVLIERLASVITEARDYVKQLGVKGEGADMLQTRIGETLEAARGRHDRAKARAAAVQP